MSYDSRVEVTLKQDEEKDKDNSVKENEISLRDLIEVILRRKYLILLITLIAFGLTFAYSYISDPNRNVRSVARVIIQYNFDGIEKGLDPLGQRFDAGKISSPVVLDRVVKKLDLNEDFGLTSSDLRNYFDIRPVVPGNIIELTRQHIENLTLEESAIFTGEDFVYYPNQFIVSFQIPEDSPITDNLGARILRETLESYIEFFYDTFTDRATMDTAFELISYDDYDYPEASYIMRKQLNIMRNYLSGKSERNPDFRSQSTGLSFGDILEGTSVIQDLDITKLNSYIRAFKLSRDTDILIATWQSRIREYELEMLKYQSESEQTLEAINRYEKDTVFVMPGTGTPAPMDDEPIAIEEKTPVYDELFKRYIDSGVRATELQHEIDYLKEDILFFSGIEHDFTDDEDEINDSLTYQDTIIEDRENAEERVVEMIDEIVVKLHNWIELTNETVDDYIKSVYYDRAVMQLTPVQVSGIPISGLRLNLAIGIVLGLMVGVFMAFMKEYWEKTSNKISSEKKDEEAS